MQIQPTIRPQTLTAATNMERSLVTPRSTPAISWETFAHRRRIARMNRDLMRFLATRQV